LAIFSSSFGLIGFKSDYVAGDENGW